MSCFEQLSGMKINFNMSDLIQVNLKEEETHQYAKIFCLKLGAFPFKYLGAPLHHDKLRRQDIQHVVVKIINRISGW
jgi:hypothetical protein